MYMPAFQAKKLVKGLSDETEGSDLQGTLTGRSRESAPLTLTAMAVVDVGYWPALQLRCKKTGTQRFLVLPWTSVARIRIPQPAS
jgi:hypothetical protein